MIFINMNYFYTFSLDLSSQWEVAAAEERRQQDLQK